MTSVAARPSAAATPPHPAGPGPTLATRSVSDPTAAGASTAGVVQRAGAAGRSRWARAPRRPGPHPRAWVPGRLRRTPRSPWSCRRALAAGALGTVLGSMIVGALAPISQPEPAQRELLGPWFGLLGRSLPPPADRLALTGVVLGAVAVLVALWAAVVRATATRRLGLRPTLALWAAWTAPFAVGPPLFSRDIYSFLAQGQLLARHLDPYRVGPVVLGHTPLLAAVDPDWRATPAPYGPLALRLQELAASLSTGTAGVLALRALALASVVAGVALAIRLAAPRPGAAVVALYGMNPVVVFHLVSGAHLEALLVALALAGVLVHRRGHPGWGLALVTAASAVKAPALLAVGTLVLIDLAGAGEGMPGGHRRRWPARARVLLRDTATVAAVWGACYLLVPDPLGWLRALGTASAVRTLATPAVALGHLGDWLAHLGRVPLGLGAALAVSTAATGGLALVWILRLLTTLSRRDLLRTTGFALVAVSVLGPVIHPWYLMWGFAFLVPAAAGGAVRTRKLLLVSTGLMALLELPGLSGLVPGDIVWLGGLSMAALVLVATTVREHPDQPRPGLLDALRRLPDVVSGA